MEPAWGKRSIKYICGDTYSDILKHVDGLSLLSMKDKYYTRMIRNIIIAGDTAKRKIIDIRSSM